MTANPLPRPVSPNSQSTPNRQTIAIIDLAIPSLLSNRQHSRLQTDESWLELGGKKLRLDSALSRLDGLTLLEWCVRRLSESTLIDTIVVTGPQSFRQKISQTGLCSARWVPSAQTTPSARACEIAERFSAEWVVFASPLCPFTDPTLLDRLVSKGWGNPDADFIGFICPNRPSFCLQALGLVGEMCSRKALSRIASSELIHEPNDVPNVIRSNPDVFTTRWIPLPEGLSRRDFRFELLTAEDRERAASYLEAMGEDISWQRLTQIAEQLA